MTFEELEYKYLKALDDLISLQQDYLNLRRKYELVNLEKTRLEREVSDLKNIALIEGEVNQIIEEKGENI